jgi:hypothetical protein
MIVHLFAQMYYRFEALVLSWCYSLVLFVAKKAAKHTPQIETSAL